MGFRNWVQAMRGLRRGAERSSTQTRSYRPILESLAERRVLNSGFGGGWAHFAASHHHSCRHFAKDAVGALNLNQTKTYTQGATRVELDDIEVGTTGKVSTVTATL